MGADGQVVGTEAPPGLVVFLLSTSTMYLAV